MTLTEKIQRAENELVRNTETRIIFDEPSECQEALPKIREKFPGYKVDMMAAAFNNYVYVRKE